MSNVKFYKKTAAAYAVLTPDEGAFYRVVNTDGTEDLYLGSKKLNNATDLQNAIDSLTADDIAYESGTVKDILDTLLGSVSDDGSIAKMINDAIIDLDSSASATAITDESGDVNVLTGVTLVDGKITQKTEQRVKKVAVTGNAEDLSVTDTAGNLDATNVEAALAEIIGKVNDANSDAKVTMEKLTGNNVTNSANTAEYIFYQGVTNSDDATAKAAKKIGQIDIAKDMVATSGQLVNSDGTNSGTFIEMTIANGTPFYINVADLIEYNSYVDTDEINVVAYTNGGATHTYQFQIGEIMASKIVYKEAVAAQGEEGDPGYVPAQAKETVTQALNRLDSAAADVENKIATEIQKLDADVDASTDTSITDTEKVAVVTGVTEVDGKLTGVDSIDVDKAGAATRAKSAVIGVAGDSKTADTINGAKAYAEDVKTTVIGSSNDAKTADTVNGAKNYADDAVATALTWEED